MPLTSKGQTILANMTRKYGAKKGKSVFYASINKGTITGAEGRKRGGRVLRRRFQLGGVAEEPQFTSEQLAQAAASTPEGLAIAGMQARARQDAQQAQSDALRSSNLLRERYRIREGLHPMWMGRRYQEGGEVPSGDFRPWRGGDLAGPLPDEPAPAQQTSIDMESPFERAAFRVRGRYDPHRLAGRPEDYEEGMQNVAGLAAAATPIGRMAASAPAALLRLGAKYAPATAAGLAGGAGILGAMTPTAEAIKLTPEQQRQVLLDRERATLEEKSKAAAREADERARAAQRAGDIQAAREADERRDRIQREAEERHIAQANKEREEAEARAAAFERAPFRERHPYISDALTSAGLAGSALIPYGNRVVNEARYALLNRSIANLANEAKAAVRAGDITAAKMHAAELKGMLADAKSLERKVNPSVRAKLGTVAVSSLSPLESTIPEGLDIIQGSDEAREAAYPKIFNWHRVPAALAEGLGIASIGSKFPLPGAVSRLGRTSGLLKSITPPASRKKPTMADGGRFDTPDPGGSFSVDRDRPLLRSMPAIRITPSENVLGGRADIDIGPFTLGGTAERYGPGMTNLGLSGGFTHRFADGGVPLPRPDPRTQDFVVNALESAAGKKGVENITTQELSDLQRRIGVTPGRPRPYQAGGALPFYARQGMYSLAKQGMLASPTPGRADKLMTNVKSGSYVIPADVVSGKGQGNSLAGAAHFDKMMRAPIGGSNRLKQGPFGTSNPTVRKFAKPSFGGARISKMDVRKSGGEVGRPTPVALSGGEYLVDPESVARKGGGNIKRGHELLDKMVLRERKKNISRIRKLPGPKK